MVSDLHNHDENSRISFDFIVNENLLGAERRRRNCVFWENFAVDGFFYCICVAYISLKYASAWFRETRKTSDTWWRPLCQNRILTEQWCISHIQYNAKAAKRFMKTNAIYEWAKWNRIFEKVQLVRLFFAFDRLTVTNIQSKVCRFVNFKLKKAKFLLCWFLLT